jgi:integrase family protein with SAM-like domain
VSRSMHAEQGESLPYNHHLHQFLTFLKHERGFADATIVNRERSLKPFLAWLVAQDVPLSTISLVVITKYFTGIVANQWKRTTVSFHVQSLRSFFRHASSRGWCAAGIAESIDAPRLYTYENLPQGPSWEDVKKLLDIVNGASPSQIRSRCAIPASGCSTLAPASPSRTQPSICGTAMRSVSILDSPSRTPWDLVVPALRHLGTQRLGSILNIPAIIWGHRRT